MIRRLCLSVGVLDGTASSWVTTRRSGSAHVIVESRPVERSIERSTGRSDAREGRDGIIHSFIHSRAARAMGGWGLARGRAATRRAATTMRLMTMGRVGARSTARERRGGGVAVASASASVAASSLASTSSSRDDARDDSRETNGRKRYAARKIVRGMTREALCDVVADVDSYASFVPFCASAAVGSRGVGSRARERRDDAGGGIFEADLEIGFKVFSERYTSAVTCARPERVTARSVSSGLFKSMTTTWRFQNLSDAASEEGEGGGRWFGITGE